jgi:hypothetical protein
MTWRDALEIVVARNGHQRYRALVADDNPDTLQRDEWRRDLVRMAFDLPAPAPLTPTSDEQPRRISIGCCGQILPG